MQEKRAGKLKGVWFGASLYNLYLLNKTHWTTGLLYDENGNTVYFLCDIRSGPKYNPNIQFHMTISATHYTYARFVCPMELTFSNTKSKQQPEKKNWTRSLPTRTMKFKWSKYQFMFYANESATAATIQEEHDTFCAQNAAGHRLLWLVRLIHFKHVIFFWTVLLWRGKRNRICKKNTRWNNIPMCLRTVSWFGRRENALRSHAFAFHS